MILVRLYVIFFICTLSVYACGPDCYEDKTNKNKTDLEKFLEGWNNDVVFDAMYSENRSTYNRFATTDDSTRVIRLDWSSNLKLTDNLILTSTVRMMNWESKSNYDTKLQATGNSDKFGGSLNNLKEERYNDIYFRALYLSYILPPINDYKHMVAFGTMPFQNGSFRYYKVGTPQEANGLSLMFDMPFDALVYVADFSDITDLDLFQVRIGHGEYMKFRNVYPQNEHLATSPFNTTVSFINFDIEKDHHKFKAEYYNTKWVFEDVDIGTVQALGFGYAYDRLEDEGYVMYGTVAASKAEGTYMDYLSMKLNKNRDKLVSGMMAQGYTEDQASAYIDSQLKNISNEFAATTLGVNIEDTGLTAGKSTTGWAYLIGAKKEIWLEEFDVDYFIGAEYFRSSKDWVSTTLRDFHRDGIDPLIKGEAFHLFTGINFDKNRVLTLSWIRENRKWGPTALNDVVGIAPENTTRSILTKRDIFQVNYTWMFLGL